jgi:DNA topoisomerase IA
MLKKMRDRGYVADDGGELVPLELGRRADELVTLSFGQLTREDFTANTERALDAISAGAVGRVEFLEAFYEKFRRLHADAVVAFEGSAMENSRNLAGADPK